MHGDATKAQLLVVARENPVAELCAAPVDRGESTRNTFDGVPGVDRTCTSHCLEVAPVNLEVDYVLPSWVGITWKASTPTTAEGSLCSRVQVEGPQSYLIAHILLDICIRLDMHSFHRRLPGADTPGNKETCLLLVTNHIRACDR